MTATVKKKRRRRCEICGQLKPADQVHRDLDPFEEEVNGREVTITACSECFMDLRNDI